MEKRMTVYSITNCSSVVIHRKFAEYKLSENAQSTSKNLLTEEFTNIYCLLKKFVGLQDKS